ncbi:MAG: helix-turn-helix domain-containing protein, partial [Solirubrobacteraceae bacterium]
MTRPARVKRASDSLPAADADDRRADQPHGDGDGDSDGDAATPLREALGAHLLELRRRDGKSLREAGALAGLSPQFISMVERGRTEIGLGRLIRLADAYDANIADLLAEINGREVEFVPAA